MHNHLRTEVLSTAMREHYYGVEDIPDQYRAAEGSEIFQRVSNRIEELGAMGFYGNSEINQALARKRKSAIDYRNPATRKMIDEYVPSTEHWLSGVPTVKALDPLYDPDMGRYANGEPITPEAREWLANCADGIGIRSRGEVTKRIIVAEQPQRIISLGCGAGRSVLESAARLREQMGEAPQTVMVDYDPEAIALSRNNARRLGLDETAQFRRKNVLSRGGVAGRNFVERALYRRTQLTPASADIVEVVGVTEYLQEEDWWYQYNGVMNQTRKPMAGAATFLNNALGLVKPGGLLIVGNMLDTHPQLGFTLNTIQWPHIQPRSKQQMGHIFDEAGLPYERDVHLPADGVYGIYTIRKPQ